MNLGISIPTLVANYVGDKDITLQSENGMLGMGPFPTDDEIDADVILKATKVDGVYDKDPMQHDDAIRFTELSYLEVLNRNLKVMDATAISMCRDNGLPIVVFDLTEAGNIRRAICGEPIGTVVGTFGERRAS